MRLRADADEFGRAPAYDERTGPREVAEALGAPSTFVPKGTTPPPKNPINARMPQFLVPEE